VSTIDAEVMVVSASFNIARLSHDCAAIATDGVHNSAARVATNMGVDTR
jgi:hypothetical protein